LQETDAVPRAAAAEASDLRTDIGVTAIGIGSDRAAPGGRARGEE
jgi:hypothetical protein